MSTEYYLTCHDCKKVIWAGCDGFSGPQFLHGNSESMKGIGVFLYLHKGHKLGYETEHAIDRTQDFEEAVPQRWNGLTFREAVECAEDENSQ